MKIIAIEGIDSAGKATQTKLLERELKGMGFYVATESFPRYDKPVGKLIWDVLNNKISITDKALHVLFEVDRIDFQADLQKYENEGIDFLILNRYSLSNLAYGMIKGINIDWIKNIQSEIKQPDITFILDIPAEEAGKRKQKKDKYEENICFQQLVNNAYDFLSLHFSANNDKHMSIYCINANRPVNEVFNSIMSYVELWLDVA